MEEKVVAKVEDINRTQGPITGMDITGKIVVLKKSYFRREFQDSDRRFLAQGGFGTKPHLIGSAVFGKFMLDGVEARVNRSDIEGLSCTNPTDSK